MIFRARFAVWRLCFLVLADCVRAQSNLEATESPRPAPEPSKSYGFSCKIDKPGLTSLAPIPGGKGGVLVGGDPWRGHYAKDGLLIGGFQSDPGFGTQPLDWPTGLLDAQLAVGCDHDPRDGILDVWTEDNYNQRLIWYRVDDREIESFEGKLEVL